MNSNQLRLQIWKNGQNGHTVVEAEKGQKSEMEFFFSFIWFIFSFDKMSHF